MKIIDLIVIVGSLALTLIFLQCAADSRDEWRIVWGLLSFGLACFSLGYVEKLGRF